MSGHDYEQENARSSVSIWTTAKGRPQWKIRVAAGEDEAAVDRAYPFAARLYRRAEVELGGAAAFEGEEPGA